MAVFLVRIELHGVKENDSSITYSNLHDSMRTFGFLKTITWEGIEYDLPSAEYLIENQNNFRLEIGRFAERAAQSTGYDYSILVTETADMGKILPYKLVKATP